MEQSIFEILDEIPTGYVFDSHYIIAQLIKRYSDVYLNFASSISDCSEKTLVVHGRIGKEIAKFEPRSISKLENMSWSENIHGNSSQCTAWEKL